MAGTIERTLPRISLNKLGEYMTATPSRRRQIVRDQRRPKGFLLPRYNEAQAAIVRCLTAPEPNLADIVADIRRLAASASRSTWEAQRNALCTAALEAFLEIGDQFIDTSQFTLSRAPQRPPLLTYGEVSISVRPELIVRAVGRTRASRVGAVKLYFSKTTPLREAGGTIAATALADFAEQFLAMNEKVDPRLCQVVDVFAHTIYRASRARVRPHADLLAACDEIARAWDEAAEPTPPHPVTGQLRRA